MSTTTTTIYRHRWRSSSPGGVSVVVAHHLFPLAARSTPSFPTRTRTLCFCRKPGARGPSLMRVTRRHALYPRPGLSVQQHRYWPRTLAGAADLGGGAGGAGTCCQARSGAGGTCWHGALSSVVNAPACRSATMAAIVICALIPERYVVLPVSCAHIYGARMAS